MSALEAFEPGSNEGADRLDDLSDPLRGSETLALLGITSDDLRSYGQSSIAATLRITHDFLIALRSSAVLDAFVQLPEPDRANFVRWVASAPDAEARASRTDSFIAALQSSAMPTGSDTRGVDVPEREGTTEHPVEIGEDRDRIAGDRDARADAHDKASKERDNRAQARDDRADARERTAEGVDTGAAADRAGAERDRRGGASDRRQAADDRVAAAADREVSARERALSSIDELTGAHRRDAGTVALEREMSKAVRTGRPLTIAFVDIDGLKATNDSKGHAAGDRLLRETVRTMRTHLRSYDLIIRFGGDEFVCALGELTKDAVVERFDGIRADMIRNDHGSITVGVAELRAKDTLGSLVERADEALYEQRNRERRAGPSH